MYHLIFVTDNRLKSPWFCKSFCISSFMNYCCNVLTILDFYFVADIEWKYGLVLSQFSFYMVYTNTIFSWNFSFFHAFRCPVDFTHYGVFILIRASLPKLYIRCHKVFCYEPYLTKISKPLKCIYCIVKTFILIHTFYSVFYYFYYTIPVTRHSAVEFLYFHTFDFP